MESSDHYVSDLLFYFDGHPLELALYQAFFGALEARLPQARVQVQKSQISFYGRHLFAAASIPVRRKKDWPKNCLLVTFGLGQRVDSPRIAVAVEPYPGRWTHHVVLSAPEEINEQLLGWLEEAFAFSESKR
jgi:hypothetical protein